MGVERPERGALLLYHSTPRTVHYRIKKMWSIYTVEYYPAIRKDEYPPFASTWMELEGIMLSEVSQAEKDNYHMVSLIS